MIFFWIGSLLRFRYATKSTMPPSYWNSARCPVPRSSTIVILSPFVRNAVSRIRSSSVVNRVVDNLVDEVMKTPQAGRADVHAGPPADRLETLEDGDVLRVVTAVLRALVSAVVFRQRSSDDIETPRHRA